MLTAAQVAAANRLIDRIANLDDAMLEETYRAATRRMLERGRGWEDAMEVMSYCDDEISKRKGEARVEALYEEAFAAA